MSILNNIHKKANDILGLDYLTIALVSNKFPIFVCFSVLYLIHLLFVISTLFLIINMFSVIIIIGVILVWFVIAYTFRKIINKYILEQRSGN